jgi:hypothetical protein
VDRSTNKSLDQSISAELVNQGFPFPNKNQLKELNLEVNELCLSNENSNLTKNNIEEMIKKEYEMVLETNNKKFIIKNFGIKKIIL